MGGTTTEKVRSMGGAPTDVKVPLVGGAMTEKVRSVGGVTGGSIPALTTITLTL